MPAIHTRLLLLASAIAMLAAAEPSVAQTTINLNTAKGNCVAVTDAAGLITVPGGTELLANGVTLTAGQPGACNPVGGSSSTFQANVQISGSATPGTPYTPAINTPFYVIWSASTDATTCTRGGNFTSGMNGWTVGSTSGPGSHAEQVTPTAAGNYSFSVTCTNASGYASTSQVSVPQPATPAPTPNPIPLTAPATATAGVAFTVTWPVMSNAVACKGSGTLDGVAATNLGDWTSLTTVTTSRNVTVPAGMTGSLKLTLTCSNADNSASAIGTSSAIAVTAGSAGGCPAQITTPTGARTLLTTSEVSYGVYQTTRPNVNLLEWDNVWGHNTTADPGYAWPGPSGASPVIRRFTRTSYLGVHFKTPASPGTISGFFTNPNFNQNPNIIMAISTVCGDFTDNLPTPGCRVDSYGGSAPGTGVPAGDFKMAQFKFTTNAPDSYCNLQPDTDYYVNMYYADPSQVTTTCVAGATTCPIAPVRR